MTRRAAAFLTVGLVVTVAMIVGAWLLATRGTSVGSTVNQAVTIECTGATGVSAETCRAWGDAVLADDAAPRTFEREDLRRLRLDRSLLGFGDECRADWFVSRYPDSPVWSGKAPCR